MKSFLSIFNKKYPAPKGNLRDLMTTLLFSLFIAAFLLFFRPFGLGNTEAYNDLSIALFGGITAVVLLLFLVLLPRLLPFAFDDKHWTTLHQVLFYTFILFAIATLNGLYINHLNKLDFSWQNYGWILVRTYVLGCLPIFAIVLIDYNRKLKRYAQQAADIMEAQAVLKSKKANTETLQLKAGNENFELHLPTFLYIEADGNYVQIHTNKKRLYRTTLRAIEQQLTVEYIVRCHRSFIVNLRQVESVSGNAQGLKLQLKNKEVSIPVSRKYVPIIKRALAN